ncbi:hypothetical protein WR25_09979 [Diploscapter pachys]|uniref:Uncharacterized protein n=1 Tax=Diploscapter pachys TaxID=2018661 RepID=A0A2A2M4G1_9BILA|nr:hypothetical protein WR25_09979 [Diploscapter pachys]
MVETDRVDRVEVRQVVAPWGEIAVPCHHVERAVVERHRPQRSHELLDHLGRLVAILEPRDRRFEIARVGEAVGADGAEIGQAEQAARAEADTTGDERDLAGRDVETTEFGQQLQPAGLGHEQQLAVGIHEDTGAHVGIGGVDVHRDAFEVRRMPVGEHRRHAVDQVGARRRLRDRVPAQAIGCERRVVGAGGEALRAVVARVGRVLRGRAHAVQPRAAILVARRGEGGAAELLRSLRGWWSVIVLASSPVSTTPVSYRVVGPRGRPPSLGGGWVAPYSSSLRTCSGVH